MQPDVSKRLTLTVAAFVLATLALFTLSLTWTSGAEGAQRYGTCYQSPNHCATNTKAVQAVTLAFAMIERVSSTCLREWPSHLFCDLTSDELRILSSISADMSRERSGSGLHFVAGAQDPTFFFLDGQVRVAKTGSDVGDPVFVNTDIINGSPDFDVFAALAILIHELGHHHGVEDHQWLDRLGAKIRAAALQYSLFTEFDLQTGESATVWVLNHSAVREADRGDSLITEATVMIWDGFDFSTLDPKRDLGLCTAGEAQLVRGLWFENFYLDGRMTDTAIDFPGPGEMRSVHMQRVRGHVQFGCATSGTSRPVLKEIFDLELSLPFRDQAFQGREWGGERGLVEGRVSPRLINCLVDHCP